MNAQQIMTERGLSTLVGANLQGDNFQGANLQGDNFQGANLQGANLQGANLKEANLKEANLEMANLHSANLQGANLEGAKFTTNQIFLASWREVSDDLTSDLMNFDAANHPDPQRFTDWINGGKCPYNGIPLFRSVQFYEKSHLWKPERPPVRPYDLMIRLFQEKGINY